MIPRRERRSVTVGSVRIGGGAPVVVQSMTNTDTRDVDMTVEQVHRLEMAGCEMVRVAVPDHQAASSLYAIKERIQIPLVADIHFDYRLALEALDQGVDKIRFNPGNIGKWNRVEEIVGRAKERGVPLRIGVNAGSLEKHLLSEDGLPTAGALAGSALHHADLVEEMGYGEIVLSAKASDVPMTIEANRLLAERSDYPLHLGITEAGLPPAGVIRSAVGLGVLLEEGIGDTIRVSLTADPVEEVVAAYEILKSLELRQHGPILISCPTCGRVQIDVLRIARQVQERIQGIDVPLRIAVMGCVVNGPGEARQADVGVAGGRGVGVIFRKGEVVRKVKEAHLVEALMDEVEEMISNPD
jgi:(E)-4-hydroxy-3-methylbut-2-enyl-diphosphate synthase